jgi:Carboxypeptidase regulatory-like domain
VRHHPILIVGLHGILVWATLIPPASAQQTPPTVTRITGVVVDAQTDVALRRARVASTNASARVVPVFTDELGKFSLDVPANLTLRITKAGYAEEILWVASPRGAGPATDVHVAMKRGAAITGRVVDGVGAPVVAATVFARAVSSATDTDSTSRRLSTLTDDLGEFRVGGLPEGEFEVSARSAAAQGRERAPADASAAVSLRVRPGDSIDVGQLEVRGDTTSVSRGLVGFVRNWGRVAGQIKDIRGRPMKATVRLERFGSIPLMATSDAQGRFRFDRVPVGSYFAEVSRPGAPTVQYGQRYAGQPGRPIDVRDGVTVNGIDFVLSAGTAIAGTISDEYGEPFQGATIRALQIKSIDGHRVAVSPPSVTPGVGRVSDDRGSYRIFGLLPGKYLVIADVDGSGVPGDLPPHGGYAPTFYPGVSNVVYALPVTIEQGDATGIDIPFRRELAVRVVGTAHDSGGRSVAGGGILLGVSQRSGAIMLEPRVSFVAPDGSFAFDSVPAGEYVVQVLAPVPARSTPEPDQPVNSQHMEFGTQYVTVGDTEPPPVSVRTTAGTRVRGRIIVDGPASKPPPSFTVWPFPTNVDLSPATGSGAGLTTQDDGSFEVTGVTGPRRFALTSTVDGWYVRGVHVGRVEAMDTPFDFGMAMRELDGVEVVASPLAAAISGTVTRPDGRPVADCAVLVFSTDPSKWYRLSQSLRLERPSQNHDFWIGSLPPGSYYMVAVSDVSDIVTDGSWQEPATLERLRVRATRVTLTDGQLRSVTLRMTSDR